MSFIVIPDTRTVKMYSRFAGR